ncbi:hypothetical protein OIE43_43825 [Streptomyces pseudovenezuelae]|uniref:ATP-dependent DNA ligase n=1 Tax=Streptomyces pseudovenezuelae TaxID=67350 RepID=UPI002E37207D|nr:hypothetical protein [Streptomyces pseudovenezuelae]
MSVDQSQVVLRSRRGTQMAAAFPEVVAGAGQLPDATAFDGELVVWENGRLAFERLQERLHRRGAGAARAADLWPAHFAFDLLRLAGTDTTARPTSVAGRPSSPSSRPAGSPRRGRCARRPPTRRSWRSG